MVKSSNSCLLICIFLCVPFFSYAQTDSLFRVAEHFVKSGNSARAILEYERIAYLSDQSEIEVTARLEKARLQKQRYAFDKALNTLLATPIISVGDSLKAEFIYEIALCAFLQDDYQLAKGQFVRMRKQIADSSLYQNYSWLEVLALVQTREFDQAENLMYRSVENSNLPLQEKKAVKEEIEVLFEPDRLPNLKDPEKAVRLSSYFPGAGQVYAGYFFDGLLNFGLQLASLSLAVYAGYYQYYITGYVGGLAIFQSFYFGGRSRAEFLAEKHNKIEYQKFNQELNKTLNQL
ncbi:MAG: hypothetical protein R6U19_00280 [Bacteroidales bacterium]